MTEPESSEPISEEAKASDSAAEPGAEGESPEPPPEPWTPARVVEWNAYYDLYVALGVVLLVFVASANKITHAPLWSWLQAGRTMAAQGKPMVTDRFSYTEAGQRWVNIPWLFEWSHALVFDTVLHAAPVDPLALAQAGAWRAGEQYGAAALVVLTALARLATVLLLLCIRHPGPGLWWSSICATMALGAYLGLSGPGLGGIAGTALVAPDTWGTLLFALELFLWHRAIDRGRRGALFALVPLFLAWANIDDSYLFGLLVLAAGVIGAGRSRAGKGEASGTLPLPLPLGRGLTILAACVAVCLVNPSFYRVFTAVLSTLSPPFVLCPAFPSAAGSEAQRAFARFFAVVYWSSVGLGLVSFVLNRRRFSLARFLMYAVAAILWGIYLPYRSEFAAVFAATMALNGQEWYQCTFGTEGRLGRGWSVWSVGGRMVTITVVFGFVALALTGWTKTAGDPIFGFGYNPDAFAFEMAEYLKTAPIQGRILNTTPDQGDALVWRTYPARRNFIDGREHLFPPRLARNLRKIREALRDDDVAIWKPMLDEYRISTVIIDEPSSRNTYYKLLASPNWIPFYDDGAVALFGRADAPAADLAYFDAHRLVGDTLVYHRSRTIPPPDRPPTPMTWIDQYFRNRSLLNSQPHTRASLHWLQGQGRGDTSETAPLPDPAHCFLAIQEARAALSRRPDDTMAYRLLSQAYRILMQEESALLDGVKLTAENAETLVRVQPRTDLLMNRFRQRASALSSAIQTTPPPRDDEEREELFTLNRSLFELYMSVNFIDLARDRFQAMMANLPRGIPAEARGAMDRQMADMNARVKQIQDQLNDLTIEQQLGPLQRSEVARGQGAPGLALLELEEAERTGASPASIRPQLVDLYCDTGQPEKAQELLSTANVEDPTLGAEPGISAMRQARVNFLLGYYEYAARLWDDRAIPQLRHDRSGRAMIAGLAFLRGQAKSATSMLLEVPGKIAQQAAWELDLGLCLLESGKPELAVEPLTQALTLAPDMAMRPVVAYYLEKIGAPVPPPSIPKDKDKDKVKDKVKDKDSEKDKEKASPK